MEMIIATTTYEDEEDIRRAVKAGARGYLVKVADCEQIEEAVRAVALERETVSMNSRTDSYSSLYAS
jgi:DNA-binding NarL/FixJ family response regulator